MEDFRYVLTLLDENTGAALQRHYLGTGVYIIGSSRKADIRIPSESVSRQHARLTITSDNQAILEDLGSTNGSWADHQRVEKQAFQDSVLLAFSHVQALLAPADPGTRIAMASDRSSHPRPVPFGEPGDKDAPTQYFSQEKRLLDELNIHSQALIAGDISHGQFARNLCRDWSLTLNADAVEIQGADYLIASVVRQEHGSRQAQCFHSNGTKEFTIRVIAEHLPPLMPSLAQLAMNLLDAGPSVSDSGKPLPRHLPPEMPGAESINTQMIDLYRTCKKAASGQIPVLILGETGTGKEVLAHWIHQVSARDGEFLALNCATLGRELLEAELFGVEKGAATGVEARAGVLERAHRGTVFLDELADMPLETQARLLRALEDTRIYRVGGNRPIEIDVRFISATNQALEKRVQDGEFRLDLFHRLAAFDITLPPLRARREDIPALAMYFFERAQQDTHIFSPGITQAALSSLLAYPWPGNIRELRNEIERAVILLDSGQPLDVVHFSKRLQSVGGQQNCLTLENAVRRAEREAFNIALATAKGDPQQAMQLLGLSRTSYYRKLKQLDETAPST